MVSSIATSQPPSSKTQVRPPEPAPRKRMGLLGKLVLFAIAIAGLGFFAPSIVAKTTLRNSVLNWLVPELASGTQIASAQFGWLSPVLMNGVIVKDDEGRPLFSAESITSSGSLLDLIQKKDSLGEFVIEKPVVNVVIGPEGSNLDPLRERIARRPSPKDAEEKGVALTLKNGVVTFADPQGTKLAELTALHGSYANDPQADPNHKLDLECRVSHPIPDGRVQVAAHVHFNPRTRESHGGDLSATLTNFPLDMLHPLVAESFQLDSLAGTTDVEFQAKLTPRPEGALTTEVSLQIPRLELAMVRRGDVQPTSFRNEAPLVFGMQGSVDPVREQATFDAVRVQSEFGNLNAKGSVSDWSGEVLCDFAGEVDYDLQLALARLPPHLRQEIAIDGLAVRNITLKGPLKSLTNPGPLPPTPQDRPEAASADTIVDRPTLEIGADVAWTSALVFGVQSNNGLLQLSTVDQTLLIDPVNVPIGTGRLTARPQIPLNRVPLTALLGPGPILEDVETTEEMCRTWLKYISPLMSDATAVEGRFSLSVDQAAFPLDAPATGLASGKLQMQEGRVGPGPIAQEIMQNVGTIFQVAGQALNPDDVVWMNMPRQDIAFQMKGGRVFHGTMVFDVGGVTVTSQGSVGTADRTLDLLVDFRLPDEWLTRGPVLAALQGETLQLKIGGTLDKPQIDNKPLAEFGKRAGVKAAAGLLFKILERRQQRRGGR